MNKKGSRPSSILLVFVVPPRRNPSGGVRHHLTPTSFTRSSLFSIIAGSTQRRKLITKATHTPIVLHSCQNNSLFEDQMCEGCDGVIEGRQQNGGGMGWLVGRTDAIWDATDVVQFQYRYELRRLENSQFAQTFQDISPWDLAHG